MKTSESVDKIFPAFVRAQAMISGGEANAKNPHFKSDYMDLGGVWAVVKPALTKNDLGVIQSPTSLTTDTITLVTRIVHVSGQWLEDDIQMPFGKATAQAIGSAITYARRYALSSIMGVYLGDDDDGNEATAQSEPKSKPAPTPKPAPVDASEAFAIARELFGDAVGVKMPPMLKKMFDVDNSRQLTSEQVEKLTSHLLDIKANREATNE